MLQLIIACVAAGFLLGLYILPESATSLLDTVTTGALALLLVTIGIDLGKNKSLLVAIRQQGPAILALPLVSGLGSLLGTAAAAPLLDMPLAQSLAVGAGFGWYSLSGILIADAGFPELGGLAFIANVLRELIAIISIPFLARWLGGYCAIAPGGATTMDTTLPLIVRSAGKEATVPALVHGMALSAVVPFLVAYLIRLF